jgi:dTDP-4-amino-4,6-dideoxygalactose transaminase
MSQGVSVPFYDHAAEYRSIKPEIDSAIDRVLNSGKYLPGKEVRAFEGEFAEYCGAKQAITTGSCYDAMFRALLAYGVGPGDEVITIANTDITSAAAISHTGASIVWADIDERTYNLDPALIEERITPQTKAILLADMYGHPADMDPILEVARRHSLFVVEDAAVAVGSRYKGKRTGTGGDVVCFSNTPSKILGNFGDGGIAVTNDTTLAQRIRNLFIYEEEHRYIEVNGRKIHAGFWFSSEGYHGRMSELSAAVLRVKLKRIDDWVARRREIASKYNRLLSGLDVVTPYVSGDVEHVFRNYTVRCKNRDDIRYRLAEKGVETGLHYAPSLNTHPVYKTLNDHQKGALPNTEKVCAELFTLPIYPELTQEQIEWVAEAMEASIGNQ